MNYFNYYTEIEDTFVRRRGKNLLLSPIDWALIEGWQQRGIPLHVAIRAIENVFDGHEKRPNTRTIKGLLYCREEIEAQYEEWLRAQAGRQDDQVSNGETDALSGEKLDRHLSALVDGLKQLDLSPLANDIERAIERLEELRSNPGDDAEHVDRSLIDIEGILSRALIANSDKDLRSRLENEVKDQLKPYRSSMDKDSYQNTFELMLLKRLREEYGIPRLSLFYL